MFFCQLSLLAALLHNSLYHQERMKNGTITFNNSGTIDIGQNDDGRLSIGSIDFNNNTYVDWGNPIVYENCTVKDLIKEVAERDHIHGLPERFMEEIKNRNIGQFRAAILTAYLKQVAKTMNLPKFKEKRVFEFADRVKRLGYLQEKESSEWRARRQQHLHALKVGGQRKRARLQRSTQGQRHAITT